jgi:hypothetical protein
MLPLPGWTKVEGHELDRKTAKQVPKEMINRSRLENSQTRTTG